MLAWDHNAYYGRLLTRAVPPGASRVLEVGCGAGRLTGQLAARADHVDALDRDAAMVAAARARVPSNVTVAQSDVMLDELPGGPYDAVLSMSVLHHLPLAQALRRLTAALRPGGTFAAVALPVVDLPREIPVEAAAIVWHLSIGVALAVSSGRWPVGLAREADHDPMPIRHPELTTTQVRDTASAVLPGVHVRRLLLWRFLLTWRAPDRDRR